MLKISTFPTNLFMNVNFVASSWNLRLLVAITRVKIISHCVDYFYIFACYRYKSFIEIYFLLIEVCLQVHSAHRKILTPLSKIILTKLRANTSTCVRFVAKPVSTEQMLETTWRIFIFPTCLDTRVTSVSRWSNLKPLCLTTKTSGTSIKMPWNLNSPYFSDSIYWYYLLLNICIIQDCRNWISFCPGTSWAESMSVPYVVNSATNLAAMFATT